VRAGVFEPFEDLKAAVAGQGLQSVEIQHIVSLLNDDAIVKGCEWREEVECPPNWRKSRR
jgi:hypothetical protein